MPARSPPPRRKATTSAPDDTAKKTSGLKDWPAEVLERRGVVRMADGGYLFPNGERYYDDGRDRKLIAPAGVKRGLWPEPENVEGDLVLLVEGRPDVLSAAVLGFAAISVPNASYKLSDEEAVRIAERRHRVYSTADCDASGRTGARARAETCAKFGASFYVDLAPDMDGGYDVGDLVADFGVDGAAKIVRAAMEEAEHVFAPDSPEDAPADAGVTELRALFGALMVDVNAAVLDPLAPLPGLPFVVPMTSVLLAGPEGGGKSQVAQIGAYDTALAGHRVLYLGGEMTHTEFTTRARRISMTRDGELTPEAVAAWNERVAFADIGMALAAITARPDAWRIVCADYALVVLDAVSDAGAELGLKFSKDNDDWMVFFASFVKACQDRTALLMLDNIGHADDARTRAIGASAKGHKTDVRLSATTRERPLSLVITCQKARPTRAPFRKGTKWVAYADGCAAPVVYDAAREREQAERGAPDPMVVVTRALEAKQPQGQLKLEAVLREAGVTGRSEDLRALLKTMADDLECAVRATKRGYVLAPDQPALAYVPTPCPEGMSVSTYYVGTRTPAPGHDDGNGTDPEGGTA